MILILNEERTLSDEELNNIPFEKAKWLKIGDMRRWVELHNKKANLYHINSNNELKEVSPKGWWY